MSRGKAIRPKDIAIFAPPARDHDEGRVPCCRPSTSSAAGNLNPNVTRLLSEVRTDVETGTSLSGAYRKHPLYFNARYCNLVEAGEAAGILEDILDRLSVYLEKSEAIKSKVKSALMYPTAVILVAFIVIAVIMIFVIPAFRRCSPPSAPTCRRQPCW